MEKHNVLACLVVLTNSVARLRQGVGGRLPSLHTIDFAMSGSFSALGAPMAEYWLSLSF